MFFSSSERFWYLSQAFSQSLSLFFLIISRCFISFSICFNPVQDGPFRGCSRMNGRGGGAKNSPSLKSVTHIHYQTSHSYTLPKEDSKNIWTTWHTSWVALTSAFFIENQQSLQYQKIQIQITFRYIISNSFNFSWVFKNFFNRHGYNFHNVSKIGFSRGSYNKDISK